MKVLVTGGAGFIGSHLVDRLLERGADVVVLDDLSTGRLSNLRDAAGDIEFIEGDIRSLACVHDAMRGCEVVFHQAALPSVPRSVADPLASNDINVNGTLNVLLAARDHGVRRFISASSSSVYGAGEELPKHEEMPTQPISPYGVAKLAAEAYCRSFHAVYGLETVALRYFNVFGPRQNPDSEYAAVIPRFIVALLAGEAPTVYGDGLQSRDFTYVDNTVDANMAALDAPGIGGRVYNVACGERITLNRLVKEVRAELGVSTKAVHLPPRSGDIRHSRADVRRARADLGYVPRVPLVEGIKRTIADVRAGNMAYAG